MSPQDLSDDAAFRIYQLMLGGIDETQPLRLATLAGVDAFHLTRDFLAGVFITAHRRYGGLRWDFPMQDVRVDPASRDTEPRDLPRDRSVNLACDRCGRVVCRIPCPHCKDAAPRWAVQRRTGRFTFNRNIGRDPNYQSTECVLLRQERQFSGTVPSF